MTIEEFREFANCLKNNYTIDFDKLPEFCDMAISALSEELSKDGTLTVHVSDGSKVKRVFVMGDNIFGGLYYPDSAENKGEWIPIEERRPKMGEVVMCCNIHGSVFVSAITHRYDPSERVVSTDFGSHYNVVAWQPLPEPYKGGDS